MEGVSSVKATGLAAQLTSEPLLGEEVVAADEMYDDHELEVYHGLAQEAERTALVGLLLWGDWELLD